MKKLILMVLMVLVVCSLAACGASNESTAQSDTPDSGASSTTADTDSNQEADDQTVSPDDTADSALDDENQEEEPDMTEEINIKITVGDTELTAVLENNAATRALVDQMPMTLSMMDLYGREMCYRYGAGGLPTDELRPDGYEVGDIAYWPPRGSLVILYEQNGEEFERQHLGHIDEGVEVFAQTGDADVTFELMED